MWSAIPWVVTNVLIPLFNFLISAEDDAGFQNYFFSFGALKGN